MWGYSWGFFLPNPYLVFLLSFRSSVWKHCWPVHCSGKLSVHIRVPSVADSFAFSYRLRGGNLIWNYQQYAAVPIKVNIVKCFHFHFHLRWFLEILDLIRCRRPLPTQLHVWGERRDASLKEPKRVPLFPGQTSALHCWHFGWNMFLGARKALLSMFASNELAFLWCLHQTWILAACCSEQFGIGKLMWLSHCVSLGSSFEALDCVTTVQFI